MREKLYKVLRKNHNGRGNNTLYVFPIGEIGTKVLLELKEVFGCENIVGVDNALCKLNASIISLDDTISQFRKGDKLLITTCIPEIIGLLRKKNLSICIEEDDIIELYEHTDLVQRYDMRLVHLIDVSKEIYKQNIEGSVAEAGVYKGEFAKYINMLFPDRKLYLFDSFDGFNKQDLVFDKDEVVEYDEWIDTHKDTSEKEVMGKMIYKENVVIRKGFVPNTFEGIDDRFSFVNLDMDLYNPIRTALDWFFPRMNTGGVYLCA